MSSNGPFGFDPDDFDRVIREAGEGLRDAVGKIFDMTGERAGLGVIFDEFARRQRHEPETTGESGDGVWSIFTVDHEGTEHHRVGRWEGCRRRWSGCSVRCVAPCWSPTTLPTTSPARRSMR